MGHRRCSCTTGRRVVHRSNASTVQQCRYASAQRSARGARVSVWRGWLFPPRRFARLQAGFYNRRDRGLLATCIGWSILSRAVPHDIVCGIQGHVWHYVLHHRFPSGDEQDIFIEDGGDGSSFTVRITRVEGSERVLYRQLLIRPRFLREFTLPGDSGALVVSSTGCPVALLHGGFVHYQGRAGIACDIGACVHYLSTQIGSPLHLTHQL